MTFVLTIALAASADLWFFHPGFVAIFGTLFGGVVLKIVEKHLSKAMNESAIRRDLHNEVKDLMERLDKVENEVTHFRTLYYAEQENVALLRVMVIQLGGELPETTVAKSAQEARDATE